MRKPGLVLTYLLVIPMTAKGIDVETESAIEMRYFDNQGVNQQDALHSSVSVELASSTSIDSGQFDARLFARYDMHDQNRSHVDIRELSWLRYGENWELTVGLSKVFWGVMESVNIVDIINQSDTVEDIDNKQKLAQPMLKLSTDYSIGTVELFWLPAFREKTFPSQQGRFSLGLAIDEENSEFESGARELRSDSALRFSHYFEDLEFAISHFSGTAREPLFELSTDSGPTRLKVFYPVIDQSSLELQYIYNDSVFKFEGTSTKGTGNRYSSGILGFEQTLVGVFGTIYDVGIFTEYLFDDRKDRATTIYEHDIFLGLRLNLNDIDSSEVQAGMFFDHRTNEAIYSLETQSRISPNWKLYFEALLFEGGSIDDDIKIAYLQNEDMLKLKLVRYF